MLRVFLLSRTALFHLRFLLPFISLFLLSFISLFLLSFVSLFLSGRCSWMGVAASRWWGSMLQACLLTCLHMVLHTHILSSLFLSWYFSLSVLSGSLVFECLFGLESRIERPLTLKLLFSINGSKSQNRCVFSNNVRIV